MLRFILVVVTAEVVAGVVRELEVSRRLMDKYEELKAKHKNKEDKPDEWDDSK